MRRFESAEETQAQADREASSRAAQIVSQSHDLRLVIVIAVPITLAILALLRLL